jgi:hypothetical protein
MKILSALAAIALVTAAPTVAPAGERAGGGAAYFENEQWVVFKDNGDCTAVAEYERGDSIFISYNRVANATYFSIINDNLRSIRDGQEYRYDMIFLNRDRRGPTLDFGGAVFFGVHLSSGQRGVTGLFNAEEFMRGMDSYQIVGIVEGETVIGSYNLVGAADAAAALRRCDAEVERVNPTNPSTGRRAGQGGAS